LQLWRKEMSRSRLKSLDAGPCEPWAKVSRLAAGFGPSTCITLLIVTIYYSHKTKAYKMTVKTLFKPCIDLHSGAVKQIVGGTLTTTSSDLQTNFTSEHGAAYYAELYKKHNLRGGHVIMLGPGNDQASREALAAWPGGLQVGGGIKDTNAKEWIEAGADKVGFFFILFISLILQYDPQRSGEQHTITPMHARLPHFLFFSISFKHKFRQLSDSLSPHG
jgi:hypothetical protein